MNILDLARAALQESDDEDRPVVVEKPVDDPHEAIRSGLRSGRLAGWHFADGDLAPGLADWHAPALGINEENDR